MLGKSGKDEGQQHNLNGGLGRPMTSPFVNSDILKQLKQDVPVKSN